ncbi:MAG: hypothetical protein KKC29_04575 [Alphaproteobacteria bacterium]|nr:hypothetical protein [Alphaproteobacteria bacterium]MBU2208391.1 hypothetical protein [Alphaproteobacteria bacterium]MBU2290354.1 hypothetical protein [Alphaproteobacteria bacterium]
MEAGVAPCALCGTHGPLKVSHIVPAFVFRWLRETSSTGHIRAGDAPTRRVQDGLKKRWLCGSCEARFSGLERRFCNELFNPWSAGDVRRVDYSDWLIRFCASVSWRILRHGMDEQPMDHLSEAQQVAARGAEETWRRFLLGELPHPGRYEQHLIPFLGPLGGGPQHDLPDNINRYLMRGTGIDVVTMGTGAFTYAKMGRFAVFGMIAPTRDKWEGTKVNLGAGRLPCLRVVLPGLLREYLKAQALKLKVADRAIPAHQRARIEEELRQNLARFHSSDQYAVMMHDADAFGIEALLHSPGEG